MTHDFFFNQGFAKVIHSFFPSLLCWKWRWWCLCLLLHQWQIVMKTSFLLPWSFCHFCIFELVKIELILTHLLQVLAKDINIKVCLDTYVFHLVIMFSLGHVPRPLQIIRRLCKTLASRLVSRGAQTFFIGLVSQYCITNEP